MKRRPDQSWRATLLILAVASLVETFTVSHWVAFSPLYLVELGASSAALPTWVGLANALPFLVGLPLVPFWGVWAQRYGSRPVLVRSALVEAAVSGLAAVVVTPAQLVGALALAGFQLGNTGVMYSVLAERVPPNRLGTALATLGMAAPLGFSLGPLLGGSMADLSGLRTVFWLDAALSGLSAALLAWCFVEPSRAVWIGSVVERALAAVRTALSGAIGALFAAYTLVLLARAMSSAFLPLLVAEVHSGPDLASTIGIVLGASALAGAAGSPLVGWLGDRFGFSRILAVSLLGGAGALGATAASGNVLVLGLAYTAFGVCLVAASAMFVALLASKTQPERRAPTLNLALIPLYASGIVGPAVAAGLALYQLRVVFLGSALALLIATPLAQAMGELKEKQHGRRASL